MEVSGRIQYLTPPAESQNRTLQQRQWFLSVFKFSMQQVSFSWKRT